MGWRVASSERVLAYDEGVYSGLSLCGRLCERRAEKDC